MSPVDDDVRAAELHNAIAVGNRVRLVEDFNRFAVVVFSSPALDVGIAGPGFRCCRGRRASRRDHAILNILMPDDRRALTRVGELPRKERAKKTRILAGCVELQIAAGVIRMEAGIDDELNRLVAEFADRRNHFIGQFARACVDDQRALVADLHGDVAVLAHQHVDTALDRQHMNFTVVRIGVHRAARVLGTAGRNQLSLGGGLRRCAESFSFAANSGYIVSAPPRASQQRHFVLVGKLPKRRVLPAQIIRHLRGIVRPA